MSAMWLRAARGTTGFSSRGDVSAGTECRPSAGVCDVAETCPGNNKDCPADLFLSRTGHPPRVCAMWLRLARETTRIVRRILSYPGPSAAPPRVCAMWLRLARETTRIVRADAKAPLGQACGTAVCTPGSASFTSYACDSNGSCAAGENDCTPYLCVSSPTVQCSQSCTDGCVSNYVCGSDGVACVSGG